MSVLWQRLIYVLYKKERPMRLHASDRYRTDTYIQNILFLSILLNCRQHIILYVGLNIIYRSFYFVFMVVLRQVTDYNYKIALFRHQYKHQEFIAKPISHRGYFISLHIISILFANGCPI